MLAQLYRGHKVPRNCSSRLANIYVSFADLKCPLGSRNFGAGVERPVGLAGIFRVGIPINRTVRCRRRESDLAELVARSNCDVVWVRYAEDDPGEGELGEKVPRLVISQGRRVPVMLGRAVAKWKRGRKAAKREGARIVVVVLTD